MPTDRGSGHGIGPAAVADPILANAQLGSARLRGLCYNRFMTAPKHSAWMSLHLVVAVVGFALYAWGFALQCRKAQMPQDFNIEQIPFPVQVENIEAASARQLRFLVEGWAIGEPITIVDNEGSLRFFVLEPANDLGVLLVTAISGTSFWSVCFFVFVPRSREPAVPLFFWILLLYGLAVMIGGVFFARQVVSARAFFGLLQIVCLALLPPLFLLLTLSFPRRQPALDHHPWLMPVIWSAATGLILWQASAYGLLFASPSPTRAVAATTPAHLADVFMLIVVAFGFANLIRQIRVIEDPRQVKQIRWLLWGFAVGTAPYLVLRTLPQLVGLPAPLPVGADRVLEIAVPLAFVFAVVREQFLDIDVIIRRSLLYSMLAAIILALMVVPSLILSWSFGALRPNAYRVALLCGGLTAGVLFNPLRRQLGKGIDRWIFKLRRDDRVLLEELDQRLQLALTPAEVAEVTQAALGRWFICDPVSLDLDATDVGLTAEILAAADATDSPDLEANEFPSEWIERGFVAATSVAVDGLSYGWLLIGPRDSRRRYLRPDLELCRQCSRRVARVLDRLRLIREKAKEAQARQRLDELNRMKSDFLAQVAHDLRTPVTSIIWSTRNMLDGLAGEIGAAQKEYVVSVSDAAGHLDNLVTNLVELSQLEQAATALPLTDFDPGPCIDRAVSTIRPLANAARVALTAETANITPVRANPEKLLEVLVNILDNAVKYAPPGGRVDLTAASGDAWCTINVTDNGPGLGALANPFERFAQGAPSPHSPSKGFGLGLYIVQQYVDLMAGEVSGGDNNDGGARFTVRLPRAANTA